MRIAWLLTLLGMAAPVCAQNPFRPPAMPGDEVRRTADEILSSPEFRDLQRLLETDPPAGGGSARSLPGQPPAGSRTPQPGTRRPDRSTPPDRDPTSPRPGSTEQQRDGDEKYPDGWRGGVEGGRQSVRPEQPGARQSTDQQPTDQQPATQHPADQHPANQQPADQQPGGPGQQPGEPGEVPGGADSDNTAESNNNTQPRDPRRTQNPPGHGDSNPRGTRDGEPRTSDNAAEPQTGTNSGRDRGGESPGRPGDAPNPRGPDDSSHQPGSNSADPMPQGAGGQPGEPSPRRNSSGTQRADASPDRRSTPPRIRGSNQPGADGWRGGAQGGRRAVEEIAESGRDQSDGRSGSRRSAQSSARRSGEGDRSRRRNSDQASSRSRAERSEARRSSEDSATSRMSPAASPLGTAIGSLFHMLAWLMLIAVCATIIYLIYRAIRDYERAERPETPPAGPAAVDLVPDTAPGDVPADVYVARARELAQAGEYREAVAQLLLGAMSHIERAGLIHYRRGLTLRDYLRAARRAKLQFAGMKSMVRVYEPLGFGRRNATREHFETSLAGYEQGFRETAASAT